MKAAYAATGHLKFQSPLPVWGATCVALDGGLQWEISIPAPRVGSDWYYSGGRLHEPEFQSPLPVWGATDANGRVKEGEEFQSPLPVWGATSLFTY